MKISDIIFEGEYISSNVDFNLNISKIATDISDASVNDILFLAPSFKGNIYDIISNPIVAIVCNKKTVLPDNIPCICVCDIRLAIANAYFRYNKISLTKTKFIGVTGTNGKTSTATFIKSVLSKCGHKVGFIGTGKIEIADKNITPENYSMTTPPPSVLYSSIRKMQDDGCDTVIIEVSSHAIAQKRIFPIKFDYGVFTNLSPEHLDYHLNMDDYFNTKLKLLHNSKCSVINVDDGYGQKAYSMIGGKKISVGAIKKADLWADEIENRGLAGIKFHLNHLSSFMETSLPVPGIFNVYNILLAIAVCIDMGVEEKDISSALSDISPVSGRYDVINDEITVIIDYAHTSAAFECILRELNYFKKGRKLTVVFGAGGERDKGKRPLLARTAEKYADNVIVTSDNSRNEEIENIIHDIKSGFKNNNYKIVICREEAINTAIAEASAGDIVAVIGKGAETYNIDKNGYHYFNEKEIIRSALAKRRRKHL